MASFGNIPSNIVLSSNQTVQRKPDGNGFTASVMGPGASGATGPTGPVGSIGPQGPSGGGGVGASGATGPAVSLQQLKFRSNTKDIASDITMKIDDQLWFSGSSGQTFCFEFFLFTQAASNKAGGLNVALFSGATGKLTNVKYTYSFNVVNSQGYSMIGGYTSTNVVITANDTSFVRLVGTGKFTENGTFGIAYAQNTSSATISSVFSGSWVEFYGA